MGRRCVEGGYAFHGEPYSLAPTMITPDGTIVTLISRGCCPYIDDPEPDDVSPAVVATQDTGKHVSWDPAFASGDSSALAESCSAKKRGDPSVLAEGAKRNRWSALVEEEDEDEYEGMPVISFNDPGDDSTKDEREWEDEVDDYAH